MTARAATVFAVCAIVLCMWSPARAQNPAPTGSLPAVIPIFPLDSPTLFPNGSFPLHIFEPRYRAMIADALKGDRIIGMVMLQPGHEAEYEGRPPIFPVGCAGLITDYQELPDGRYNIVLGGLVKFRVTSEDQSRAYRLAHVTVLPETLDDRETTSLRESRRQIEALLLSMSDRLGIDQIFPGIPDEQVVDELSQHLPMPPLTRQQFLEREDPLARAGALIELLQAMAKSPR